MQGEAAGCCKPPGAEILCSCRCPEVGSRSSCKPPIRYMLYFREELKQSIWGRACLQGPTQLQLGGITVASTPRFYSQTASVTSQLQDLSELPNTSHLASMSLTVKWVQQHIKQGCFEIMNISIYIVHDTCQLLFCHCH